MKTTKTLTGLTASVFFIISLIGSGLTGIASAHAWDGGSASGTASSTGSGRGSAGSTGSTTNSSPWSWGSSTPPGGYGNGGNHDNPGNPGDNGFDNNSWSRPAPVITSVTAMPSSGTLAAGNQLKVDLVAADWHDDHDRENNDDKLTLGSICTVNNVSVSPLENLGYGRYRLTYTVGANDTDRAAGMVPIDCDIKSSDGKSTTVTAFTDHNTVAVNTTVGTTTGTSTGQGGGGTGGSTGTTTASTTPGTLSFSRVAAVPNSGILHENNTLEVQLTDASTTDTSVSVAGTCTVNNVAVGPLQNVSGGMYQMTYTVGANDSDRAMGTIPIDCMFHNGAGATTTVTSFTDGNTLAIDVNGDGIIGTSTGTSTTTTGTTGSTTGSIGGTVSGGASSTPLSVTSITPIQSSATADGTYADGWSWTFNVTVPDGENNLAMKFADWTNSADSAETIPVDGNMEISSPQASTTSPITLTGSNVYSLPLALTSDADPSTPGRQVQVTVQMRIPPTTVNGSYNTSYGVESY